MNVIKTNSSSQVILVTPNEVPAKGALAFAWEKIKALGEALAIAIGLCSLVGIPIIYTIYKKSFVPTAITFEKVEKSNPKVEKMLDQLESLLKEYINDAKGKKIDLSTREKMNEILGAKVAQIFKENGVSSHFSGILHPIFRELMRVNLKADLENAKSIEKIREILLAYGYDEDDVDPLIQKYN